MNKKFVSAVVTAIAASIVCAACPISANAYTDNNGAYHSYEYMASRSFANANNYFLRNYGSSEVELTYPILRNGSGIGTLHCFFNYEYIGASYGSEMTSTTTNGYYMDGNISSNGNYNLSTTRRRGYNGYYSSSTYPLSVYGSNNVNYLGSIYY